MAKINWKSNVQIEQERIEAEQAQALAEAKKLAIEEAPAKAAMLQEENMNLMLASAETYEQMYNENMTLMLAVAEMYEELQTPKGGI